MSHDHTDVGSCRYETVNGLAVHVVDRGDGPAVVMVHGSQAWAYAWRYQIPLLSRHGYRAISLDLPGSGYSDPMPGNIGIEELSGFLAATLDRLQVDQAFFVASSAGGLPVLDLAIRRPERINGLILSSACGVPHRLPWLWRAVRVPLAGEALRFFLTPGVIRANLHQAFYCKELVHDEMVAAYLTPLRRRGAWSAQVRMERNWRPAFVEGNLACITAPSLVVWGENDTWHPPAMAGEFKRRLAHAEVVTLPQCGHLPHEEKPDEFNEILLDWLGRHASGI